MKDGTITITNIGSIGGTYATPVINHPEVAIIGTYKIEEKPKFVGDRIEKGSFMNTTITADHRLIDGAVATRFLRDFNHRLSDPAVFFNRSK
jgi:pyruvate dehydrogenase E2 component (dihydrolipoamide acetyltransferase)